MKLWKKFFTVSLNIGFFLEIMSAVHGLEYISTISGRHHFPSFSESFTLFCDCGDELTSRFDQETNATEIQSNTYVNNVTEDKVTFINIYQGTRANNSSLVVEDNMLLNTSIGMYSYDDYSRKLNISTVPHDVAYVCSCLHEYVTDRTWVWTRDVTYLYILDESTYGSPNKPQCVLITGIDGVVIAGVGIELHCMFNETITVTFQNSTGLTVDTREVNSSACSANGYCSYFFSNATVEYNETKLICLPVGKMTGIRDMCSHIPKLLVVPRFLVFLTSDSDTVSEGGSVTLTCVSNLPVMTYGMLWQVNYGFQGNFDISEDIGQNQLTISNVGWNSSANNEIKVSCRMIFNENVFSSEEYFVRQGKDTSGMTLSPDDIFIIAIVSTIVVVISILCFLLVIIRECTSTVRKKQDRRSSNRSTNFNQMSSLSRTDNQPLHQYDQQQHQNDLLLDDGNHLYHHNIPYEASRLETEEDEEEYDYDYSDDVEPPRSWLPSNQGIYQNVKQNSIHF